MMPRGGVDRFTLTQKSSDANPQGMYNERLKLTCVLGDECEVIDEFRDTPPDFRLQPHSIVLEILATA